MHLSTDIWTARNLDSYITLDARFFDLESMESHNINLAVRIFNIRHTHEEISDAINELLCEFELGDSEIKSGTVVEHMETEQKEIEDRCEVIGIDSDSDSDGDDDGAL